MSAVTSLSEKEQDVEATRHRLYETIDRIQDRLTPAGLVDEAIGIMGVPSLRLAGDPEGTGLVSSILRRHPVPVMVAAAGLGWIVWRMNKRRTAAAAPSFESEELTDLTAIDGIALDPPFSSGRVKVYPAAPGPAIVDPGPLTPSS